MKISRRFAAVVAVAASAAALGYGVASASAPATPASPNAQHSTAQKIHSDVRKLAAVSSGTAESTYVPVSNCRVVNTSLAGGKIPNGSTRNFYVAGTVGFPGQGGQSGGCGVPTWATAVSARLTGFTATGNGAFSAYPTGTPTGQGTLYYAKGVNVTTGATLQLGTNGQVSVRNTAGPAYTAIDVNGYFVPQIHAVIANNGTISTSNSNRIIASVKLGTGSYRVQIAGSTLGCTPIASIDGSAYFASSYLSGSYVYANTYTPAGATVDLYWTLHLMC